MDYVKLSKKAKVLFKHKIPNLTFILSFVFVMGGWIWAFLELGKIKDPLIIHYSQEIGIDQVGYAGDLAKVGVFGLVILLINFIISGELEQKDRFLSRLTSAVTVFIGILIFIYFAAIISVN